MATTETTDLVSPIDTWSDQPRGQLQVTKNKTNVPLPPPTLPDTPIDPLAPPGPLLGTRPSP